MNDTYIYEPFGNELPSQNTYNKMNSISVNNNGNSSNNGNGNGNAYGTDGNQGKGNGNNNPVPIGDGLYFLILFSLIYLFVKKHLRKIKTALKFLTYNINI